MNGLTRNPLGILAIFLGVLYGIAGLLLGITNGSLSEFNQTLLTCLVVVFPFVALGTFAWLVARHHTKLYSPTDYRSDEGFFASLKGATPIEAAQKIEIEALALEKEMSDPGQLDKSEVKKVGKSPSQLKISASPVQKNTENRDSSYRDLIKKAEDAVFIAISDGYESIRRSVKLHSMGGRALIVDGIGSRKGSSEVDLIEVVVVSRASMFSHRSRDIAFQLSRMNHCLPEDSEHRNVLCLVFSDSAGLSREQIVQSVNSSLGDLELDDVEFRLFERRVDGCVVEI